MNGKDAFYSKLIYDYVTNADRESVLVSQMTVQNGTSASGTVSKTYNYTYDDNGNITQITNASGVIQNKYYYDALGQLVREDNRALNNTYTYSYDNAGNITAKKRYAFTTGSLGSVLTIINYGYGNSTWGDLLTSYGGTSISYDTIGNPTAIDYAELTWQGRTLTEYYDGDMMYYYYEYNADGIRTYKEYDDAIDSHDARIEYILNGSQIIGEHRIYQDMMTVLAEYTLIYIYDEAGSPIGLKYREPSYAEGVYNCYFFEKNLQGDIISIFDTTGYKIGAYNYDAWGNFTIDSAATDLERQIVYEINPFRYRGYYYDVETGWYYLQSRYYNPEWGRFLNADGQLNGDILGCNQFSYCGNNPVIRTDFSGKAWGWVLACTIVGGLIGGASKIISNTLTGKPCNEGVLGAIAGGATYGLILSTTQDIALAGYMSATAETAVNELTAYSSKTADLNGMEYKEINQNSVAESLENIVTDTIVNGTINTFTGYLADCFIPGSGEIPKGLYECLFSEAVVTSHIQTMVQGGITVIFNVYAEYQTSKTKESNNGYYYRQRMPILP